MCTPAEWPACESDFYRQQRDQDQRCIDTTMCPIDLLPKLPRPNFSDFFEGPLCHEQSPLTVGLKRSRHTDAEAAPCRSSSPAWPSSWAHYHFTFATLLLEEARAALASAATAVSVAEI